MIDYKKLSRLDIGTADQEKIDTVINIDHRTLISQYNDRFIKYYQIKQKKI